MGIFSFFLPVVIFGAQTAIFRLQKHKFSIKSKILFGYSIFMLTFVARNKSNNIMKYQVIAHCTLRDRSYEYVKGEFLRIKDAREFLSKECYQTPSRSYAIRKVSNNF